VGALKTAERLLRRAPHNVAALGVLGEAAAAIEAAKQARQLRAADAGAQALLRAASVADGWRKGNGRRVGTSREESSRMKKPAEQFSVGTLE
jgi:lysozyme family protein